MFKTWLLRTITACELEVGDTGPREGKSGINWDIKWISINLYFPIRDAHTTDRVVRALSLPFAPLSGETREWQISRTEKSGTRNYFDLLESELRCYTGCWG